MAKKLYVGNLSYGTTDSDLQNDVRGVRVRGIGSGDHGP